MNDKLITATLIIIAILSALCIFLTYAPRLLKQNKLKKYKKVFKGMGEAQMLSIMGKGYTKSILSNGSTVYEWGMNSSTEYNHRGLSGTFSSIGRQSISITVFEGEVVEVLANGIK